MKKILILLLVIVSSFVHKRCFGQKDSGITIVEGGWSMFNTTGKLKNIAIDSGDSHLWYKSNYKSIPEHGIFIDTLSYNDSYSKIKIIRIFNNRELISSFMVSYRNYEKPYFDYDIKKKYLLTKSKKP